MKNTQVVDTSHDKFAWSGLLTVAHGQPHGQPFQSKMAHERVEVTWSILDVVYTWIFFIYV